MSTILADGIFVAVSYNFSAFTFFVLSESGPRSVVFVITSQNFSNPSYPQRNFFDVNPRQWVFHSIRCNFCPILLIWIILVYLLSCSMTDGSPDNANWPTQATVKIIFLIIVRILMLLTKIYEKNKMMLYVSNKSADCCVSLFVRSNHSCF